MCSDRNKLCLSVFADSLDWQAVEKTAPDLLEIRLDRQTDYPFAAVRARTRLPLIATLRTAEEGGEFSGTCGQMANSLQSALAAGWELVDVGLPIWRNVSPLLVLSPEKQLVLSAHLSHADPLKIRQTAAEMLRHPAAVYKLVFTTEDAADFYLVDELAALFKAHGKKYVVHAMGAEAWPTRILGAVAGNAWTYVSSSEMHTTAAGQLSIEQADALFTLRSLPETVEIVGLLGNPVKQSKGWLLHNRLLRRFGPRKNDWEETVYLNFRTARPDAFWQKMADRLSGLSVTIPYKETVVGWALRIMPEVAQSGAANTLVRTAEGWLARNGDVLAVRGILERHRDYLSDGVGILGNGGAAAAVASALKMLGVQKVFILGRSAEKAARLAKRFGFQSGTIASANRLNLPVLIQTTPVGMAPAVEAMLPVENALRNVRLAVEAVYNPAETRFLKLARQNGALTVSGVEWFLEQARLQTEWFYGRQVSAKEIQAVWNEISEKKTR